MLWLLLLSGEVLEVLIVHLLLLLHRCLLLRLVEACWRSIIHRWWNLILKRRKWLSSKLLLLLIHLIVRILLLLRLSSSEDWMHDGCRSGHFLFRL